VNIGSSFAVAIPRAHISRHSLSPASSPIHFNPSRILALFQIQKRAPTPFFLNPLRTLALFQIQERAATPFLSSVSALFTITPGVCTPSPRFMEELYDPQIR
jgi:hypothetical protein